MEAIIRTSVSLSVSNCIKVRVKEQGLASKRVQSTGYISSK